MVPAPSRIAKGRAPGLDLKISDQAREGPYHKTRTAPIGVRNHITANGDISPCRGWPENLNFRRVIFRLPRRA